MANELQGHIPPVRSSQWVNALSKDQQDQLLQKVRLVQSWIDGFAAALGKRKPPKARIAEHYIFYAPWANAIAVPARTLMEADERLLRIAVAHECGHFNRRWRSLLSWSEVARTGEEILADRVAMRLTGATFDDLDAAVTEIAAHEGCWEGGDVRQYIALRRQLHQLTGTIEPGAREPRAGR